LLPAFTGSNLLKQLILIENTSSCTSQVHGLSTSIPDACPGLGNFVCFQAIDYRCALYTSIPVTFICLNKTIVGEQLLDIFEFFSVTIKPVCIPLLHFSTFRWSIRLHIIVIM
jgi:hypothetical protein